MINHLCVYLNKDGDLAVAAWGEGSPVDADRIVAGIWRDTDDDNALHVTVRTPEVVMLSTDSWDRSIHLENDTLLLPPAEDALRQISARVVRANNDRFSVDNARFSGGGAVLPDSYYATIQRAQRELDALGKTWDDLAEFDPR